MPKPLLPGGRRDGPGEQEVKGGTPSRAGAPLNAREQAGVWEELGCWRVEELPLKKCPSEMQAHNAKNWVSRRQGLIEQPLIATKQRKGGQMLRSGTRADAAGRHHWMTASQPPPAKGGPSPPACKCRYSFRIRTWAGST